jgi:alkylated DNA repair dioxygenase AlkB
MPRHAFIRHVCQRYSFVMTAQLNLFNKDPRGLPEGMRYAEEVILPAEEQRLAAFFASLPFKPFEFVGGLKGNRRVVSFGWRYDFNAREVQKANDIPPELLGLRQSAARFAHLPADRFQQVLVTEYAPGAGIGWHKDRPVFGEVIGVSLLAPCNFRLRRKTGASWARVSFTAESRSAYLLSGESRSEWEHSIPPLDQLRYSVTFRNFRHA